MKHKMNVFLFIVGIILSVIGGVLEFSPPFSQISAIVIIFIGLLIGLLNINVTEEAGFLLSSLVFITSVFFILPYLKAHLILVNAANILENFAVLTASATTVVSLRWVFNFASTLDHTAHKEHVKHLPKFEKYWGVVMLFFVAIVIVQVVVESFFDVASYKNYLMILDYVVLGVFVIDLIIIYIEVKSFKEFLKTAWLDIIATIPFSLIPVANLQIFRSLKVVRVFKIIKLQKAAKIARANRAFKFFSDKSKFNHYVHKKK